MDNEQDGAATETTVAAVAETARDAAVAEVAVDAAEGAVEDAETAAETAELHAETAVQAAAVVIEAEIDFRLELEKALTRIDELERRCDEMENAEIETIVADQLATEPDEAREETVERRRKFRRL